MAANGPGAAACAAAEEATDTAGRALSSLVDELCMDLCVAAHKAAKTAAWTGGIEAGGAVDMFGNTRRAALAKTFSCHNCARVVSVTKYAQHLETCLNLKGSRASRARRQSTPAPVPDDADDDAAAAHPSSGAVSDDSDFEPGAPDRSRGAKRRAGSGSARRASKRGRA